MTINFLDGGTAEYMGDGVFVLMQKDETGVAHSVAVEAADLKRFLAAAPS